MKFRTDFVTNSSSSSFLTFNVKNKALFKCLTKLGIKFENTKKNVFSDRMRIVLPSGERAIIDSSENRSLPYVDDYSSISAWIVALLLWEVEDIYPEKEEDNYSEFSKELIALLNEADITHLDWEAVKYWSRDTIMKDLSVKFDQMDEDIEDATIEHTYGFESEVGPCIYTEVHNGKRMSVDYTDTNEVETEKCNGLKFVVTGKLKYFENRDEITETIEKMGGYVTDRISKNTDYLICSDIHSDSSKMEKAKELGIAVLTETAFIRRFCDINDYDDIQDSSEIAWNAGNLPYEGGVLDFVAENGTQPIVMEVWKDGRWQKNESDQKAAIIAAAQAAKREEVKKLASTIFEKDGKNIIKALLINRSRDCLMEGNRWDGSTISFEDLCRKGFVRFEIGPLDAYEEKDCFLIIEREDYKDIFNKPKSSFIFTTICKHDLCDLTDYKNRGFEISLAIINRLCGREYSEHGKFGFLSFSPKFISDEYMCYTLRLGVRDDVFARDNEKVNVIEGYNRDNEAIMKALLSDLSLRKVMGIEDVSVDDAYTNGYIRTSEYFAQERKTTFKCWIIITWEFWSKRDLTIIPVSRDQNLLEDMSNIINNILVGLELPVRGTIKYQKSIIDGVAKLSDNLFCKWTGFVSAPVE